MPKFITYLIVIFLTSISAVAAPVLMISIDGLRASDVVNAQKLGLKIPTLQKLMAEGAYATSVTGVLPSVTYPSHTTLITGVSPALHGISNNFVFDPYEKNKEGWYWYASDIKIPTLWDQAHSQGKKVANVNWPASVGAASIDYNIPEYWRAGTPDDIKLLRALATPGLMADLEKAVGVKGFSMSDAAHYENPLTDEVLCRFAARIIETKHPDLTTLHVANLDHVEHVSGPGTKEANAVLEKTDAMIGILVDAARKAQPDLVVAIVSDHGFTSVQHDVHLVVPFVKAGLVSLDAKTGTVKSWKAMPWDSGGSAAIVLADPNDPGTKAKVEALLKKLAADSKNGIAKVIAKPEIEARGAALEASFIVDFVFGYEMIDHKTSGPLVTPSTLKGMHGYFPEHPEMQSAFVIAGPGVPKKGSLGEIDMRDIAPTIAKLLGVSLPSASGKSLL